MSEPIPNVESGTGGQAGNDAGVPSGANGGAPQTGQGAPSGPDPVEQIRAENAELRRQIQEVQANTKKAEDERLAKQGEFETLATQRATELEHLKGELLRERRQNALQREAVKHGLRSMDFLKLIDPANVIVTDTGEVQGAAEALAKLKESHGDLFESDAPASRTPGYKPTGAAPKGFDPNRAYTSDEIQRMDSETFQAFRNRDKPAGDSKLGF